MQLTSIRLGRNKKILALHEIFPNTKSQKLGKQKCKAKKKKNNLIIIVTTVNSTADDKQV